MSIPGLRTPFFPTCGYVKPVVESTEKTTEQNNHGAADRPEFFPNYRAIMGAAYYRGPFGFSVTMTGKVLTSENCHGYAVSLMAHEKRFADRPLPAQLREYINSHIMPLMNGLVVLGGWEDEGVFYLDVSVIVQNQEEALRLAAENKQSAIYSFDTGEIIRV